MATVYAVVPRPLDSVCPSFPLEPTPAHPHHTQNPQAGPSTSPQSTTLKKKPSMSFISASTAALTAAKRKRTDTPDDTSADSSNNPPRKPRDGPKKKKANRACYHCQKAHLTCDDCRFSSYFPAIPLHDTCAIFTDAFLFDFITSARPCQRCIKRGFAANCTEGHRKKAKYLLDDDELGVYIFFSR